MKTFTCDKCHNYDELAYRLMGLLRGVGARGDIEGEAIKLVERWHEPHRHYHDCGHLVDCLAALDEYDRIRHPIDPVELTNIELALFWHGAVYKCDRNVTNEVDSALEFSRVCNSLSIPSLRDRAVGELILATQHAKGPHTPQQDLIVDIDLLVLSAPVYDLYVKRIRKEYCQYTDEEFAVGRAKILAEFLERPIYHTSFFKNRQFAAEENLRREIRQLKGSDLSVNARTLEELDTLHGKVVKGVIWHDSHGDSMEMVFTDGTKLNVCSFSGTETKYKDAHPFDLYVGLNGLEL